MNPRCIECGLDHAAYPLKVWFRQAFLRLVSKPLNKIQDTCVDV